MPDTINITPEELYMLLGERMVLLYKREEEIKALKYHIHHLEKQLVESKQERK